MDYHDYIALDNARREREQQLAGKYKQQPEPVKVTETSPVKKGAMMIIEVICGLLIVAAIIYLSILV